MKLFVSTIVIASVAAQEDDSARNFGDLDLGNYGGDDYAFGAFDNADYNSGFAYEGTDYSDLYASYGVDSAFTDAAAAAAVAADEAAADDKQKGERYFSVVTTPAITTLVTIPDLVDGAQCWKCDKMTYAKCASEGIHETCTLGDKDCCFLEVRLSQQGLQQLCTGCKDLNACYDNKAQNIVQNQMGMNQCSPDHIMAKANSRFENHQSVCRTCFNTCHEDGNFCFGGISKTVTDGVEFKIPYATSAGSLTQQQTSGRADTDINVLGIPTGVFLNTNADLGIAVVESTTKGTNFFPKTVTGTGETLGSSHQVFWSVEAGDRSWWNDDHMSKQTIYRTAMNAACTGSISVTAADSITGCTFTGTTDFGSAFAAP